MTGRELLRNRALLALLARDTVSSTGSQMTALALPWFVLTTSGSATRMALVLAVQSASMAVFGFLSGNVAARLGPRRTMLVADAARAPLVALIPLLHALDALSFPLILVIAAAISAFVTPSFAAKTSLVPELVGEDERALSEANALLQGAQRITLFLGPGARRRADRGHRRRERPDPGRRLVRRRVRARRAPSSPPSAASSSTTSRAASRPASASSRATGCCGRGRRP